MGNRINDDPSKPCLLRVEQRTLREAEEACSAQGGRLATFQTKEDAQELREFAKNHGLYIGLYNKGDGWKFHGSGENATAISSTFFQELFGHGREENLGCAHLRQGSNVLHQVHWSWCEEYRNDWICEGTSENRLSESVVATGDLKADEGAFCLWQLPQNEYLDYLPNDEGGFKNTELACRLQTGSSRNPETCEYAPPNLVARRGHYSNKRNYPVMGSEIGWTGDKGNVPFLTLDNAYDVFHCHFTPENSGLLRMYAFQHMYERNYPGAVRRTCGCGYRFMSNLVSRCDCTRNGVRSNNCARFHREKLRKATEPKPVKCNNCNADTNL